MIVTLALVVPVALVLGLGSLHGAAPSVRAADRRPAGCDEAGPATRPPPWFAELHLAVAPEVDPTHLWARARWAAPAGAVLLGVAVSPVAALVTATAIAGAVRILRPVARGRRLDRRDRQLPAALERLASAVRAGSALAPGFVEVAASAPEPLGGELRAAAAEVQHGATMVEVTERWVARTGASPAVRLSAAALSLGAETGGEVARSLDRVAATLRERSELQAEVRSLATQAQASAVVLAVAPVAFTGLISGIEPGMVRFLVGTPAGLLCLVVGVGLEALGAAWMARIVSAAT
jgi:tight adherence protein B